MKFSKVSQIIVLCLILLQILLLGCEPLDLKRVMDTTTDEVEITGTSVIAHGTLLDVGEAAIIDHGHCWSRNPEPTIDDSHTDLGEIAEAGGFSSKLFGLIPGQKHYIRSYVYDGINYSYGEELSFEITANDIQFNSLEITKLDEVGAILVTSSTDGIGSVTFTEHGHCWSQNDPPTVDDLGTSAFGEYIADTSFTSQIRNLTRGVYYIRGYLESEGTIIYTNTLKYESIISVGTGIIKVNPNSTAIAEGEINSLGVNTIVDHGHCWSAITSNPNINYNYNSLGSVDNLGEFNSNIEGLDSGRTYYIRAYAFDGTTYYYGETKSFMAN